MNLGDEKETDKEAWVCWNKRMNWRWILWKMIRIEFELCIVNYASQH